MSVDPVTAYALEHQDDSAGVGPLVRMACKRHLLDLEQGPKRGLRWDWSSAKRVVDYFAEVLKLAGGTHEGKPFNLEPSQVFVVGSIFGWKTADGFRRFRVSYNEMGKGNGKSPIAAGIGLYMLTADDEARAEVYAAAVDKDQAKVLFRDAVAMTDQSEALTERLRRSGGRGREYNLAYLQTGSFFRPISSESTGRGKSGPRPHCVLLDEVHEHPTNAMVEFMRAGTKGRTQALIFMITNAGVFDPTSVCFQYHDYSEKVLNGTFEDDSFFAFICSLDKCDDWKDPSVWRKTNPLLGVSITEKYLQEQVREAVGMPSKQSLVRRLNFCEWMESADPFVEPEVWRANGGTVPKEQLVGRKCYGGLDLSKKNDLTALELVFPMDDGTKAVLSFFWTPEEGIEQKQDKDRAPYKLWIEQGYLIAKPGPVIDYGWVARTISDLSKMYRIEGIAYDRDKIEYLKRELADISCEVELFEHGQGFRDMNTAIIALEDDLKEKRMRHGDHPILSWCCANARVTVDPAENRKFDKRKATGRIDGIVALAMADCLSKIHQPSELQFFVLGG